MADAKVVAISAAKAKRLEEEAVGVGVLVRRLPSYRGRWPYRTYWIAKRVKAGGITSPPEPTPSRMRFASLIDSSPIRWVTAPSQRSSRAPRRFD